MATAACDRLIELQAAAAEDETWSRQIHLMWEKLSEPLMLAGLQRLGQPGEPVSYLLHEPIDTVDTADATLHMRVAKVLSGGYAYQGKVLRKARVTVYRAESISQKEG